MCYIEVGISGHVQMCTSVREKEGARRRDVWRRNSKQIPKTNATLNLCY